MIATAAIAAAIKYTLLSASVGAPVEMVGQAGADSVEPGHARKSAATSM